MMHEGMFTLVLLEKIVFGERLSAQDPHGLFNWDVQNISFIFTVFFGQKQSFFSTFLAIFMPYEESRKFYLFQHLKLFLFYNLTF